MTRVRAQARPVRIEAPGPDPGDGPDRPLYFLHIPKCAGTTFRAYIEGFFDVDEIWPHWYITDMLKAQPSRLRRCRCVASHSGFYLPQLLPEPPRIVTMLRDPLARTLSHFRHMQNRGSERMRAILADTSFEAFLDSPIGIAELTSFQTRYIAFDDIQADYFGHPQLKSDRPKFFKKLLDPRLLELAKERLASFEFVGVQERFDDSLRLLAHTQGWPAPVSAAPVFNTGLDRIARADVSDAARRRIEELTALDRELYEFGRSLFEARLSHVTPEAQRAEYRRRMGGSPRVTAVALAFERGTRSAGLLPREQDDDGRWTRRVGPGRVGHIDLPLDPALNYRLTVHLSAATPAELDSTLLSVNGLDVDARRWFCHDTDRTRATLRLELRRDQLAASPEFVRIGVSGPSIASVGSRAWLPVGRFRRKPDTSAPVPNLRIRWLDVVPA